MRWIALLLALLMGACSQPREAPCCTGTPFVLNAGMWQPTAADLAVPAP
jgi:hypothetical protein